MAVMFRKLIVSYWQAVYFLHFCTLIILFEEKQLSSKHLRTHGASLSVLSKII